MPWLGGLQTGRGAAVVRCCRAHQKEHQQCEKDDLPPYLALLPNRSAGWKVTRIRFNHQGNKFGIVDGDGALSLWQTNTTGNTPKPYLPQQGLSTDNRNVCLWDTLVTTMNSLVHTFSCHESLAPRQQLLITGGRKGWISVLELPHWRQRQSVQAHDSPVKALAVDPTEGCFISGSAESNIKVWGLSTQCLLHQFPNEHARQSLKLTLQTGYLACQLEGRQTPSTM
ncbi:hypothetical protein J4Q44_G00236760 [Coregonus suidteri]|uniref:Uncharacterized protein n=1 Tax=Coregonus suidteri TaxID=861788 RepID=A0AAN8LRS2_9TELE